MTFTFKNIEEKVYIFLKNIGKKVGLDLPYFVKNGFWMMIRQFADLAIGMVLFVVFARLATKEALGNYQFVMSILAVISLVSIPGLNTSVLRVVSRGFDGEYVPSVKKSFKWSLIGIPLILVIGCYYYIFKDHALGLVIMVSSILFPFFYAPNTWSSFLQGKGEYKRLAIFGSIQSLINAMVTILVIYIDNNSALLITTAYLFSYSTFNVIYYYKSLKYIENSKNSGEAMKYGWFLTKINFFTFAAENVDKVIIGTLISPASLAIFTVVSALPFKLRMVVKSIFSVAFPKMSQDHFIATDFFMKKQGKILLAVASAGLFFMGIIYFFTVEPISRFFFGEKYSDYYYYGKYFTILVLVYAPLLIASWYTQAKKMSKAMLYINIISFVVKIPTLIAGVILWGIVGAIWVYNVNMVFLLLITIIAIILEEKKPVSLSRR